MKIAYLTADFGIPVFGNKGASIHVREFSEALNNYGHKVQIFTPRLGGPAPSGFEIPVHELALEEQDRMTLDTLRNDPVVSEEMVREIRSLVYTATYRHRLAEFFRTWRPDAIYERYSLLATAGTDLARKLGVSHILEVNAPLSEEAARHRGVAFSQAIREIEQRTLHATNHIVAVSDEVKDWAVSKGVHSQRITTLPNGVNPERFDETDSSCRARLELDDRPIVGFVGTLKAWHGTETLIEAMGALHRIWGTRRVPRLLIVGDGPERQRLQDMALAEGIADFVTFTGSVPHDEIPALISIMDIAVAPYKALSGFYFSPLKVFEYMAAGRAIVASDIGQIADCLRHSETGLLYPPGNVQVLADRIAHLIENPDFARSLGQAARADAVVHHGWDRHAAAVTALIEQHSIQYAEPTRLSASGGVQ